MNEQLPSTPTITIPPIMSNPLFSQTPRKKSKWWIGVAGLLIVAGLGVGGWFLYRTLIPTPEEVLTRTLGNLPTIKTFHVETLLTPVEGEDIFSEKILELVPSGADLSEDVMDVEVSIEGDVEIGNFFENDMRFFTSLSISALREGVREVLLATDVIEDQGVTYSRVSAMNISAGEEFGADQVFDVMFESFLNQWIGGTDDLLGELQSRIEDIRAEKMAASPLTDAHLLRLKETWEASMVFSISQIYEKEIVNGEEAYHYGLMFDADAWDDLLDRCEEILNDTYLGSENGKWSEDMRPYILENTEVWISTSRYLPLRIKTTLLDTDKESRTDVDISLSAYGDPVVITAPTDAITSMEMLKQMLTAMGEYMKEDSDGDGLTNEEEVRYETDAQNPDSDGDGYLDGEEVEGGYDPNGPGVLTKGGRINIVPK